MLSRLTNLFWLPGPEATVAIIGLDGVGKYTLMQRLSQTEIRVTGWVSWATDVKRSKSYRWNMNLVQTYVGYSEKAAHKKWVADHFCDSDGIIFIIDDEKDAQAEACEWLNCYACGFEPSHVGSGSYFLKVREGIPWLILANRKKCDSPLMTVEDVRRTLGLDSDSLEIDSHVEVVNILTGDGVDEAMSWLRKRINTLKEERLPMKELEGRQDGKRLFS